MAGYTYSNIQLSLGARVMEIHAFNKRYKFVLLSCFQILEHFCCRVISESSGRVEAGNFWERVSARLHEAFGFSTGVSSPPGLQGFINLCSESTTGGDLPQSSLASRSTKLCFFCHGSFQLF